MADLPSLTHQLEVVRRKVGDPEHTNALRAGCGIRGDTNGLD
ncbi:hypothetical protein [Thiomonas sp. FB-6]|nr:hypothetical protein [Thiomonas sp. FB-6]